VGNASRPVLRVARNIVAGEGDRLDAHVILHWLIIEQIDSLTETPDARLAVCECSAQMTGVLAAV
jgi:hypothetical protein